MDGVDLITADIGRKCADDVSAVVRRNIALVETKREAMIVAMYGASVAIGASTGAMAAFMGNDGPINAEIVDEAWSQILRPMVLGHFSETVTP